MHYLDFIDLCLGQYLRTYLSGSRSVQGRMMSRHASYLLSPIDRPCDRVTSHSAAAAAGGHSPRAVLAAVDPARASVLSGAPISPRDARGPRAPLASDAAGG